MRISTNARVLAVILISFIMLFALPYAPAYMFYPVMIGMTVVLVGPILFIVARQRRRERMTAHMAKDLARFLWRVDGDPTTKDGYWLRVHLRHFTLPEEEDFWLLVREAHPEIEQFVELKDGDIIQFQFISKRMYKANIGEISAYMRIKGVAALHPRT